jgi:hypothetical protein
MILIVAADVASSHCRSRLRPDLQQYNGKAYMRTYSLPFVESDFGLPGITHAPCPFSQNPMGSIFCDVKL